MLRGSNISTRYTLNWYINIIVYQMEFERTRWSCPWNSDQRLYTKCGTGGELAIFANFRL